MSFAPAAEILILADDEATAQRLAAALGEAVQHVRLAAEEVADPARLELVVVDQEARLDLPAGSADQSAEQLNGADLTRPGVIRIGGEGPADLQLPADVTDRELGLACRMLAEIVRLRRKDHAASQTQRRLAAEALTDPLTGLPNRRAWDRALRERVASTGGTTGRLCLAVVDLDHFKRVNDAHGHAAGDDVLRAAGRVISGGLRQTDFVARLGGDEFGLLLAVPDEAMARAVVDRVRRSLPAGLARHGAHRVTASAGFHVAGAGDATAPLPSPDALFLAADTALAQAKREGRDQTVASVSD